MRQLSSDAQAGIPSSTYTHDYYVNCCDGYTEFIETRGERLPRRLQLALQLAEVRPGMQVLDIGCGRGELLMHVARSGAPAWGIDYATAAVELAQEALMQIDLPVPVQVVQSSALQLPFPDASIDRIFMLDVVEHLLPSELTQTLRECRRVLKAGGKLIVHTMPNLWYYHFGYPLYRGVQRLRGVHLPRNPRERWAYHHVHVNEQTPISLFRTINATGFQTQVWLQTSQNYDYENSAIVRWGMNFLTSVRPFRWVFCNDIFAVGTNS
jgi:cyclopropane fatty-acyl-phospholipid synthase-like methyltransferase